MGFKFYYYIPSIKTKKGRKRKGKGISASQGRLFKGLFKLLNQSIDQKNNLLNKQFEKEAEANESIITSLTDQINADYEEINHNHEKLINIQKQVSIRYVEFEIFKKNRLKELIAAADELCIEIRKELHRKVDVNKYFELRKAHSQKVINFYSESAEKQKIYIDELLKGFE